MWCRQGASSGGGPGLALAGSPGTGPLPLGTGDALDRVLTQNRSHLPVPIALPPPHAVSSLLFLLCFYLHAFFGFLYSIFFHRKLLLFTVTSCFSLPLVSFPVLFLPSLFNALTCHMVCP